MSEWDEASVDGSYFFGHLCRDHFISNRNQLSAELAKNRERCGSQTDNCHVLRWNDHIGRTGGNWSVVIIISQPYIPTATCTSLSPRTPSLRKNVKSITDCNRSRGHFTPSRCWAADRHWSMTIIHSLVLIFFTFHLTIRSRYVGTCTCTGTCDREKICIEFFRSDFCARLKLSEILTFMDIYGFIKLNCNGSLSLIALVTLPW